MNARVGISVLLFAATTAWGFWLLGHVRSKEAYVRAAVVRGSHHLRCEWTRSNAALRANLGFSIDDELAWSDRRTAYVALSMPATPAGGWLDLDVAAVAAKRVVVEVEGGGRYVLRPGRVRLQVPPNRRPDVLMLTFRTDGPKAPSGEERRWLGVAVSGVRVCAT